MNREKPYISFVVASRNDDHSGKILDRMSLFIRSLDDQACRHDMNVELVVVEWNPLPDRKKLEEIMPKPSSGSPLRIRYVEVPSNISARWRLGRVVPFLQWIAKNAGIRRACGEFVLATNADLLFSDELCRFLARERLDAGKMYRANKCDVPESIPKDQPLPEQLLWCERNILRRLGFVKPPPPWGMLFEAKLSVQRILARLNTRFSMPVDTNACGDFTLMAKSMWEEIKGYPEITSHAHVDEMGCFAAVVSGAVQEVLPPDMCVYHIDHAACWNSMSALDKIALHEERPSLDFGVVKDAILWMRENRRPLPINDENWGCAHDAFREVVVAG